MAGQKLDENQWCVDGPSECLAPAGRPGPFRTAVRWSAAVDRITGASERHSIACIEFRPGAGLWTVVSFESESDRDRWQDPIKGAFRYLADTGFGGERSRGWGRAETPEFIEGVLPELILAGNGKRGKGRRAPVPEPPIEPGEAQASFETPSEMAGRIAGALVAEAAGVPEAVQAPAAAPAPQTSEEPGEAREPHWLLSLYTPGPADAVDWSRGNYRLVSRCGRVESPAGSGDLKKHVQMVAEGSVVYAPAPPRGAAPDVAPEGFAHPVYRAGFAVAIPLPEVR